MIEPGALLDSRYELEKRIGVGGAGEVWRARHTTLNSIVAVKILHVPASRREVAKKRFLQEARVTAQLRIRQAVQVHDFGFVGERPYLVMELLEGGTLKALLASRGSLPVRETTVILRQAARALERAHAMSIIHRDFKPDNVFVLQDEEGEPDVRVVDFGIAKLIGGFDEADDEAESEPGAKERDPLLHFTRTGGMLGTPYYMAPEQVQSAADLGVEVDVWSFGVVAYECLTGKRPFGGENAAQLFQSILEATHEPARKHVPSLPKAFDTWFDKACAPDPKNRFADIRTAVATLEEALGVLPILGPTWFEATDASISFHRRQLVDRNAQPNASNSLSGTATAVARKDRSRRLIGMTLGGVLLSMAVLVGVLAGREDAREGERGLTVGSHPVQAVSEGSSVPVRVSPPVAASSAEGTAEPPPVTSVTPPPASTRVASKTTTSKPGQRVADKPTKEPEPAVTSEKALDPVAPPENTKPKPPSPLNLPPLGI